MVEGDLLGVDQETEQSPDRARGDQDWLGEPSRGRRSQPRAESWQGNNVICPYMQRATCIWLYLVVSFSYIDNLLAKPWSACNAVRGLWRPDNRGARSTSMDNTSLDAFIRMIAAQGILGILRVIGAAVFALSWLVLPCFICAVQRSISIAARNCAHSIARWICHGSHGVRCKASNGLSPYDTTNTTI